MICLNSIFMTVVSDLMAYSLELFWINYIYRFSLVYCYLIKNEFSSFIS